MGEHSCHLQQHHLNIESDNRELRGLRTVGNALKYLLTRSGKLSLALHEAFMFFRSQPGLTRPDAECMMVPLSFSLKDGQMVIDDVPGFDHVVIVLRPESQGSIIIDSADAREPAYIRPNYFTAEYDRKTAAASYRFVQRLLAQPAMQAILRDKKPPPELRREDEIIDLFGREGATGYHATGTCRMGGDDASVLDPRLRVRGVDGLRVADCSVFPFMMAGHTNAPVMAMAMLAADLILEDARN